MRHSSLYMNEKRTPTTREVFVNNLKFYRKQKGLSQEKLSNEIGMSMTYINQVENKGSWPQPEIVDKIANSLGVSIQELFGIESSPQNVKSFDKLFFVQTISDNLFENLRQSIEIGIERTLENDEQIYAKRMKEIENRMRKVAEND